MLTYSHDNISTYYHNMKIQSSNPVTSLFLSFLLSSFISASSVGGIQSIIDYTNDQFGYNFYISKELKFIIPVLTFVILSKFAPVLIRFLIKAIFWTISSILCFYLLNWYLVSKNYKESQINLIKNGLFVLICFSFILFLLFKLKTYFFNKKKVIKMEEIDNFGGGDPKKGGFIFESYISGLYNRMGYDAKTVSELKKLGIIKTKGFDQGADVIVDYYEGNKKVRAVIQCKHYKNKVGNSAIQEVKSALALYKGDVGIVLTNNYFTEAAIELAAANNVQLIDRDKLYQMVEFDNAPRINFLVNKIRSHS